MKTVILLFFTVACLSVSAQDNMANNPPVIKDDFKPSTLNQPGQQYPQVNSQGYARFKITAPDAKSIVVSLGLGGTREGTELRKVDDGTWVGTTAGPMEEGFHYYHVTIDGVKKSADELKASGINAVSFVSENTRHEFQTWRRSLYHLAQLLFK
ncbi:hypothetical protein FACS189432_09220 [Bacteroidia bacterium]|nr:hypothetical protein FACS189432_09220 [Bacteroidia bacterium]